MALLSKELKSLWLLLNLVRASVYSALLKISAPVWDLNRIVSWYRVEQIHMDAPD